MNKSILSPLQLVAHRGHQSRFPENSLLAILDAIAAGAKKIEFDIQLSQDGVPFLYHDADMTRVSGADANITKLESDDVLRHFSIEPKRLGKRFESNPIDRLIDLLPIIYRYPSIQFFLELKEESLEAHGEDFCFKCLRAVLGDIPKNVCFISFNLEAVKRAKQEGFYETALVFRDWANRNSLLKQANSDFGFINYTRIPLSENINADKPIMVYEVTHANIASQLLGRGAFAVETFHIRSLLNNL